jgi:hypothetical protein
MSIYDSVALVLAILAVVHAIALGMFLRAYFQGRLMSIGYGFGFGGPKYIAPFITWFIKDKQ